MTPSAPTVAGPPVPPPDERVKPVWRGWIHLVALGFTVVAGSLLIAAAPTLEATVVLTIYVLSMVALFGVSAAFHRITWTPAARRRMRRADHATIFLAIAGSYTAVAGLALSGWAARLVLAIVWIGAAAGVALRQLWLDAPKWVIAIPYVVVGWSALAVAPELLHALGAVGFTLLVVGGLFYTAGALVYAAKRPDPRPEVFGYHEIFHACTVVGAVLHFVVIAGFALPLA